jgi:exonuclease SbcD
VRFIHTADWHLGRILHNVRLVDDQAIVLDRLCELAKDARPDFVAVAGDVYDRAVPPREAVGLLDEVLSRLVRGLGVPVVLIAGNHDSPERLGFGSRLLAERGLHLAGVLSPEPARVVFEDAWGPVRVYSLPYAEPAVVRERLGFEDLPDHSAALRAVTDLVRNAHPDGARSIVLAHAFVAGGEECESERPLSVGGSGAVDAECFAGFHYTALGHLHRAQSAGNGNIRYSGSLLKYSFSEAEHHKSVNVVEMDREGNCTVEAVPLSPRRDVRRVQGTLEEIRARAEADSCRDDYIMAVIEDREPILYLMDKLREIYPNTLHIERTRGVAGAASPERLDHRGMSESDLFAAFFRQVTGEDLSPEQRTAFETVVDRLHREEREA